MKQNYFKGRNDKEIGREEYFRKGYRVPKGTQHSLSLLGIK